MNSASLSRSVARKFVRHVRKHGARHVQVWLDGVVLNPSQKVSDIVEALTCTDDAVVVRIRGDYETPLDGLRRRRLLGRCVWVTGNGKDALSDWKINEWSDRVFSAFLDEVTT